VTKVRHTGAVSGRNEMRGRRREKKGKRPRRENMVRSAEVVSSTIRAGTESRLLVNL